MTDVAPRPPEPAEISAPRNIFAVASGKGGVGKTWLSITLSHALAKSGHNILLFDGDFGLANVDVQLGLAPRQDLGGVLAGRIGLSDAVHAYPEGGFDLVAGRSGSGSLASLSADRLGRLMSHLSAIAPAYDRVVLDIGAGIDRTVRDLATFARTCLVVTTEEPTALTDAYAFIKLTYQQKPSADLRIVVNMADSERDGEGTYATLSKACNTFLRATPPLAGILRRDKKVRESIRNQSPLLMRHPNCAAAADVEALARNLLTTPSAERRRG